MLLMKILLFAGIQLKRLNLLAMPNPPKLLKIALLLFFPIFLIYTCGEKKSVPLTPPIEEADFTIGKQELKNVQFKNNLIRVFLLNSAGDTIWLYTDTGGGNFIYPSGADALAITPDNIKQGDQYYETADLSGVLKAQQLPTTIAPLMVYRGNVQLDTIHQGMLGANWFAKKIWEFDYRQKKTYRIDSVDWAVLPTSQIIEAGFLKNDQGVHATHFPRLPMIVDGDTIQMLFDTGAQALLSEEAKTKFDGVDVVGASFIIASIFDDWAAAHPDWRILKKGDARLDEDLIEVPSIQIGQHKVGPVWFARRKDSNFTEYMSKWMDQQIQGALGGSAFQYFSRILIDYREGKIYLNP